MDGFNRDFEKKTQNTDKLSLEKMNQNLNPNHVTKIQYLPTHIVEIAISDKNYSPNQIIFHAIFHSQAKPKIKKYLKRKCFCNDIFFKDVNRFGELSEKTYDVYVYSSKNVTKSQRSYQ